MEEERIAVEVVGAEGMPAEVATEAAAVAGTGTLGHQVLALEDYQSLESGPAR